MTTSELLFRFVLPGSQLTVSSCFQSGRGIQGETHVGDACCQGRGNVGRAGDFSGIARSIPVPEPSPTFGASGSTRISGTRSRYPPSVRKGKTFAATFAGERIALYRGAERHGLRAGGPVRPPPGAAEHGRRGGRHAALLLSRLGLSRERPHLADTVPAQGGRPAAARGPRLPGPRGLRPGVRLPGRPGKADATPLPELPEFDSARHKTMTFSRTVAATTRSCTRTCWT